MNIVFIPTATEAFEILPKLSEVQKNELQQTRNILYPFGSNPEALTPVYLTGVGKTNAAITCTKVLLNTTATTAILIGVAGAYRSSGLSLGDVVAVSEEHFVDEATLFNNTLTLTSELGFPVCKNNAVKLNTQKVNKHLGEKKSELIHSNTVSLLSSNDYLAELYSKKTMAQIENMEGAAFALAAIECGVKPTQLRGISNYCGNRDKQDWQLSSTLEALASISTKLFLGSE